MSAVEEWRAVEGHPGCEISSHGQARGKSGKLLKPAKNRDGYLTVYFSMPSGRSAKTVRVNRAVALAFLPNPREFPVVNHKDGDRCNNHVSNLEWTSKLMNSNNTLSGNTSKYGLPKGVKITRCKLADGRVKSYYYTRVRMPTGPDGKMEYEYASFATPEEAGAHYAARTLKKMELLDALHDVEVARTRARAETARMFLEEYESLRFEREEAARTLKRARHSL